jgi:hypothetical protein
MIFGITNTVIPTQAAQSVAYSLGQPGPYDMPGIPDDTLDTKRLDIIGSRIRHRGHDAVFGFKDIAQYREWFTTPEVRRALFLDVKIGRRTPEEIRHPKWNDLELREFEVPDDDVFVADHQVVFDLDTAKSVRQIPREEAIA